MGQDLFYTKSASEFTNSILVCLKAQKDSGHSWCTRSSHSIWCHTDISTVTNHFLASKKPMLLEKQWKKSITMWSYLICCHWIWCHYRKLLATFPYKFKDHHGWTFAIWHPQCPEITEARFGGNHINPLGGRVPHPGPSCSDVLMAAVFKPSLDAGKIKTLK